VKLFADSDRIYARIRVYYLLEEFILSGILTLLIAIGTIIYTIKSNKDIVEQLTLKQKFGVSLIFIATIAFATVCIYFGGNWIVSFMAEGILKTIMQYIIILVVLIVSILSMHKAMHKVTNGII